jgi:hypothetical protein
VQEEEVDAYEDLAEGSVVIEVGVQPDSIAAFS